MLQTQMSVVQGDVNEIKSDIREIKVFLAADNFVTQTQFTDYKRSQVWQKVMIAFGFLLLGALVSYFFTTIGQEAK